MPIVNVAANLNGTSNLSIALRFFVASGIFIPTDGTVLVHFSEDLSIDTNLLNPASYSFSPAVTVHRVYTVDARTVALITSGFISSPYTLTVSLTLQDTGVVTLNPTMNHVPVVDSLFGNPVIPYSDRSLYTDNGPIVKPIEILQSGIQWSVQTTPSKFYGLVYTTTLNGGVNSTALTLTLASLAGFFGVITNYTLKIDSEYFSVTGAISTTLTVLRGRNSSKIVPHSNGATVQVIGAVTLNEVVLPGGAFNSSHIGLQLQLSGSAVNGGSYKVLDVISPTRLKVQASFRPPTSDPNDNSVSNTWVLRDLKTGFIANDPADVVVKVNGSPVTVDKVIGLQGQIVLAAPIPTVALVRVNYSWIYDPTVEIRRLNSTEFRLNNGGKYKYRNVLQRSTGAHSRILVDDIRAPQPQPLLRDVFYRAFERRYTAALNDPTLLRLNTPRNRIAYPPLTRKLSETSVSYNSDTLPEADLVAPWERRGSGVAIVAGGDLTVIDNTSGPYPSGQPFYWTRGVDLTFSNIYAATWRMQINATVPDGVFTGITTGWSDNYRAVVLGFLLDGGVRKIGFLKQGAGNNVSLISSWTGGVDINGNPTGLPFSFDWSILHSYRFFKDIKGTVEFFVDVNAIESLKVTYDQLPLLEELDDTFNEVQNIFFGSLSREATNQSTWQFVRYLVLPTNAQQSLPFVFVPYVGTALPENSPNPWTPIGYHGNETLIGGSLILDSTSYTTASVGLIGGDFRGFTRIEPLLSVEASVALDIDINLRTFTHGITNNAVMAAIDDGNLLTQVCFFPTQSQPKVSYPGRSMPQDATPRPWTSFGGSLASMIGRTLRINDSSTIDGRVFAIDDPELPSSLNRIFETSLDYLFEFQCAVISFVEDGTSQHFCGVTVDVFDDTRAIGVMLRKNGAGPFQVAFHSDGVIVGSPVSFNWGDGKPHTYRVTKNTLGNLVVLFVDSNPAPLISLAYTSFLFGAGPATLSFGSSTAISSLARSVVDWYYVNGWRAQPASGVRHYVGIWKGSDSSSLLGYYLPLKVSGKANSNTSTLTDLTADFVADLVQLGDYLIIDDGVNRGVYSITNPITTTTVTIVGVLPQPGSTVVTYRIPNQTDWLTDHTYQLLRDSAGFVGLFQDSSTVPLIRVDYLPTLLPPSSSGLPSIINRGLPSISWGAFDSENLSQTAWTFVKYSITTSPIEVKTVPPHQVLNQRNVMASPEHLFGVLPHNHTQFSSASTGVPIPWEGFVNNPSVRAFTKLNEGTPLVPLTQTFENRRKALPLPPVDSSGFGNSDFGISYFGSVGGLPPVQQTFTVPDGVLYNKLQIIEKTTGELDLLSAFSDEVSITLYPNPVGVGATISGGSSIVADAEIIHHHIHISATLYGGSSIVGGSALSIPVEATLPGISSILGNNS